jgi:antitoxin VapB
VTFGDTKADVERESPAAARDRQIVLYSFRSNARRDLQQRKVEDTYLGTKEPMMALSIKDPETERLARSLAQLTGENITTATRRAIEERLRRVGGQPRKVTLLEDMAEIRRRWREMTIVDERTPEEILGYDEHGLPR